MPICSCIPERERFRSRLPSTERCFEDVPFHSQSPCTCSSRVYWYSPHVLQWRSQIINCSTSPTRFFIPCRRSGPERIRQNSLKISLNPSKAASYHSFSDISTLQTSCNKSNIRYTAVYVDVPSSIDTIALMMPLVEEKLVAAVDESTRWLDLLPHDSHGLFSICGRWGIRHWWALLLEENATIEGTRKRIVTN